MFDCSDRGADNHSGQVTKVGQQQWCHIVVILSSTWKFDNSERC